jgi:hypothetical protein
MTNFNSHDLENVIRAIVISQAKIKWKSGKAEPHLAKRIKLGHLSEGSNLAIYEDIIKTILNNQKARVYAYVFNEAIYPTLTAMVENRLWLVMIGIDGILETAFPPNNADRYLINNPFVYLGVLEELVP